MCINSLCSQISISVKNDFQQLVLDVLHHDVVPELRTTGTEVLDANSKTALRESVELLLNHFSWQTLLSTKQSFCFAILNACCSKITISKENFDWVQHYGELNLGLLFEKYCKWNDLLHDQCIIDTKLPDHILAHSEDLQK